MLEDLLVQNFYSAMQGAGFDAYESVFLYLSYSHEADTDKLLNALISEGKRVYCPRVEGKEMKAVLYGELSLSSRGIREPLGEAFDGDIDVAIVPLTAVDEKGNRLGYGGGYYDKYLSAHPKTLRIGYCYEEQVVREIPVDDNDIPLTMIVTDKRIIYINNEK